MRVFEAEKPVSPLKFAVNHYIHGVKIGFAFDADMKIWFMNCPYCRDIKILSMKLRSR